MSTIIRLVLWALLVYFLVLSNAYDYNDIIQLNASCSPKDTCAIPRDLDNPKLHNCDCSSLCVLYDTCCIDSPFRNLSSHYERSASCKPVGSRTDDHIFVVDTCPLTFNGSSDIRRRCEGSGKNWSDPLNNVPATHLTSQTTYKSIFCALCHRRDPQELILWKLLLDCTALKGGMQLCQKEKNFVLNNIMYIQEAGVWGLWSYDSDTDWMFRHLSLSYEMPDRLKKFVQYCRPHLVSDCHPNWRNARISNLCQSYMGAVYFQNVTYRNIHCAMCNYEMDLRNMSCHATEASSFKGPNLNFGVLLDFDLSDGEKVGHVQGKCGDDEVHDPFAKKCRKVACPIPGFQLVDKKCVPE